MGRVPLTGTRGGETRAAQLMPIKSRGTGICDGHAETETDHAPCSHSPHACRPRRGRRRNRLTRPGRNPRPRGLCCLPRRRARRSLARPRRHGLRRYRRPRLHHPPVALRVSQHDPSDDAQPHPRTRGKRRPHRLHPVAQGELSQGLDKPRVRPKSRPMSVNIQAMPAGRALEALRAGWTAQAAGALTVSWMLHGRPGVGKTEIVETLAGEIGARLFDLRLTTIEPQDLRGLPYYDHAAGKTVWYRPEDLPDDPGTPSVLFLDELTAAAPYLQPTVYGLLQERRVGRHVLPDTVFIVAAGNSVEDGAVAYEMGTALSDRLIHINVMASASDWLERFAVD